MRKKYQIRQSGKNSYQLEFLTTIYFRCSTFDGNIMPSLLHDGCKSSFTILYLWKQQLQFCSFHRNRCTLTKTLTKLNFFAI